MKRSLPISSTSWTAPGQNGVPEAYPTATSYCLIARSTCQKLQVIKPRNMANWIKICMICGALLWFESQFFVLSPLDHSVFEHKLRASHCRWGLTARAARRKPPDSVHRRKLLNWSNEPLMYPSKTMKTLCWKLQIIPERSPTLDPGFLVFQ